MRTTQAQWNVLVSSFDQYKQALQVAKTGTAQLRLLVAMTNLIGSFNLPTDVQETFDESIGDVYDCTIKGVSNDFIEAPRVIYSAFDGMPVVNSLKFYTQFA